MSVLSLKADINQREWHVRYVPIPDLHEHGAAVASIWRKVDPTAATGKKPISALIPKSPLSRGNGALGSGAT